MSKDSDEIPTRVIKREVRPRPVDPDAEMTRPVGRKVEVDPEQVVTRRISRPVAKPPSQATPGEPAAAAAPRDEVSLPSGWLTVIKGPGRGHFLPVFIGMNSLGRDPSNRLAVNFGDEMISRADHAFIVYDDEHRAFWVQHGGKSNLVRLNDMPVLAPSALKSGDIIRVGTTELRFTAFCDEEFDWTDAT
jgi:hypothetical protein